MPAGAFETLKPEGALTMATAQRHLERGRKLARSGNVIIDFSGVAEADSAALALLFDWTRTARAAGHEVLLRALPPGLASIADLYGVAELLPSQASETV